LHEHLRTLGVVGPAAARIPWVYQWNKRDVPVAVPIERLRKALNPQGWPEFEAVASENKGVSETLRAACKAVLARLGTGHAAAPAPAAPSATAPVAAHAVAAGSSPSPLAGPHVPQAGTALAPPPAQPLPMQASPAASPRTAPIPGSGNQFLRSPAFAPRPAAAPAPAPDAPAAPPAKPPVLPPIDRTRRP
jgi:hypothetical protein